ncbi:MAG: hypothetical protein ACI4ST_02845 [Candidatus Gallimonas sp.]
MDSDIDSLSGEKEQTAVSSEKCPGCGDNLKFDPDSGCLKCPSCGTTVTISARAGEEIAFAALKNVRDGWQNQTHVYHCSNCNAEEALDKREIAHVCPFCGSPSVVEKEEIDTLRPNALLPFSFGKDKASQTAVAWAKKKWFAPKAFKSYFRPENLNGVYLPAFTFDTNTRSVYQGTLGEHYYVTVTENGKSVRKRKTRYFAVNGTYDCFFDDIAVNATDAVPKSVMKTLLQYDYKNSVVYDDDYLYGFSALLYSRNGEACWQEARTRTESTLRSKILAQYRYDVVQSLNVNTTYSNVTYKYLLLPMYTGNYTYKEKAYSFYINGRNGKVKGNSPVSRVKAGVTAAICAAVVAAIGLLIYFL